MIARLVIIIVAPIVLFWAFVSTFWREIKYAPWYACAQELPSIRTAWRLKSLDPENWK